MFHPKLKTMNLDKYYKENKDNIHSTIMEIASDLAKAQLIDKYQKPFGAFLQPEDPDNPDNRCTCYKEKYQDEFNLFYDNEYDQFRLQYSRRADRKVD